MIMILILSSFKINLRKKKPEKFTGWVEKMYVFRTEITIPIFAISLILAFILLFPLPDKKRRVQINLFYFLSLNFGVVTCHLPILFVVCGVWISLLHIDLTNQTNDCKKTNETLSEIQCFLRSSGYILSFVWSIPSFFFKFKGFFTIFY